MKTFFPDTPNSSCNSHSIWTSVKRWRFDVGTKCSLVSLVSANSINLIYACPKAKSCFRIFSVERSGSVCLTNSSLPLFARLLLVKLLLLQHFTWSRANQFQVFNVCCGAAITAACWVRFYRLWEREWHFILVVTQNIILLRALVFPMHAAICPWQWEIRGHVRKSMAWIWSH